MFKVLWRKINLAATSTNHHHCIHTHAFHHCLHNHHTSTAVFTPSSTTTSTSTATAFVSMGLSLVHSDVATVKLLSLPPFNSIQQETTVGGEGEIEFGKTTKGGLGD
ncbi:hypothetical protein Bca52824_001812 [Brassica carinata]|uniref:Uncharacterized protein n=1 Tax=Brassica carinata TaxID=52824 RepID=A0A8X7WJN9_BRACI|nr:hypothetical protein Bca52824_001812 [Brassica carinata]